MRKVLLAALVGLLIAALAALFWPPQESSAARGSGLPEGPDRSPNAPPAGLSTAGAGLGPGRAGLESAPADGASAELAAQARIRGRVIGIGGQPLPGALCRLFPDVASGAWGGVRFANPAQVETLSDADGRFALEAGAGHWCLSVTASGYVPWSEAHLVAGDQRQVLLELGRGLQVRVSDGAGQPLAGVELSVSTQFRAHLGPDVVRQLTDGRGEARLAPVGPGRWYLSARGPGLARSHQTVEVPQFGEPAPVDLRMSPGLVLQGRLLPGPGQPGLLHPRVRVEAFRLGPSEVLELVPDASGHFASAAQFLPGEVVRVLAEADGLCAVERGIRLPETPEKAEAETIELVLDQAEGSLRGYVVDEDRQPVAGAEIRQATIQPVSKGPGGVSEALGQVSPYWERWRPAATSAADGSFQVRGWPLDRQLVLVVQAEGFAPRFLWPDAPAPGGLSDLGAVSLEPIGGLFGQLLDSEGRPLAGQELRATREIVVRDGELDAFRPTAWWRPHTAKSDSEGRFRLEGLSEGTYEIGLGSETLAVISVASGQHLGPLELRGSPVTAAPTRLALTGSISDGDRRALARMFVAVFASGAGEQERPLAMTFTDLAGRFDMHVPGEQALTLKVSDPKGVYSEIHEELGILSDSVQRQLVLSLDPEPREPLVGLLRSPLGLPLAGVEVILEPPQNRWCGCATRSLKSDELGFVVFEPIGPGEHNVRVRDPEGRFAEFFQPGLYAGGYFEALLSY